MDQAAVDRVAASVAALHAAFAPCVRRQEAQHRSAQHLRGRLGQQTDRRNAANLAEAGDSATPRTLQRFLTAAPWPTAPVFARKQR